MLDRGKKNILGVMVDAVDYDAAVARIVEAAVNRESYGVSALAVHGVMTGVLDPKHGYRLNRLDLVVPDGQPVRWALNLLHRVGLRDRVYGPELMRRVIAEAAARDLPIYLYGSRAEVLEKLSARLLERHPDLRIAGMQPSKFRTLTMEEKREVVDQIERSGAAITFVGLGCPRQEVWVYEYRDHLPMPMLAVGAAFDFHAGTLPQAPPKLQRAGLEWLFRLAQEPRRLWRRYLYLNPLFTALLVLQRLGMSDFLQRRHRVPTEELSFG